MKVKIFMETTMTNLEDMINDFISREEIEIIRVDFSSHSANNTGGCAVMITYRAYGIEEKQN